MKATWPSRELLILATLISACLQAFTASAQSMELHVIDRDASATHIRVMNADAANINLQGSFDLENWFHIESAAPILGVASFEHTNDEPIDAWFYRAVSAPAPIALNVGPKLDTNQFTGGLILPEAGGQLQLTDANGVFYQLTVRSNLVAEPTAIRMTVITNFTGMPLTNRFRAAVAFEPDGLEFRGQAELKIRFPAPIPALEMMGYGFAGDGADFHLRPWESTTNEVTIPVTHFSGIGVAAEPFTPSGSDRYGQGLKYTRDAIREADDWAGDQYRDILSNRSEEKITAEESARQKSLVKRQRDLRIYLHAIKPLLAAAERDCDIGQVLLRRLDQLDANTSGESLFYNEIVRIGPAIRCLCARKYLELCERDAISGIIATDELNKVLDLVALKTGRIDDPNCDLGSDFDILRRLARAKCHKPWEGTVRYTKTFSSLLVLGDGSFFHTVTNSHNISYVGHITELLAQEGDVLDDGAWQSWTMKLAGKFAANREETETTTTIDPNWTVVDSSVSKGVADMPAEGELIIRFDNGIFNFASAAAGLGTNRYSMPLRKTTQRTVECRQGPNCPQAILAETTNDGTESLSFAESPSTTSGGTTVEWQPNGSLKIVLKRTRREEQPPGFTGHEETTETITIQIWRGAAP